MAPKCSFATCLVHAVSVHSLWDEGNKPTEAHLYVFLSSQEIVISPLRNRN